MARNYRSLRMHRIPYTDLTEAQITQLLRPTASGPGSKSAFPSALAGKRLKIVTDEKNGECMMVIIRYLAS